MQVFNRDSEIKTATGCILFFLATPRSKHVESQFPDEGLNLSLSPALEAQS